MADFCSQCSITIMGEDFGDFRGLEGIALVICEGCGPIQVNLEGQCISADCLEEHGSAKELRSK